MIEVTDQSTVLLAGDTHGNTSHIRYLHDMADREGCEYIFQVGDFGYWPHTADGREFLAAVEKFSAKAGRVFYWEDGNHDKSSAVDHSVKDDEGFVVISDHVRYAPRGHRWTWNGVRFIALGGAYSVDKQWRLDKETQKAAEVYFRQSRYGSSKPPHTAETLWFPEEELTDAELAQALADITPVDVMLTHDKPRASNPRWNRKDLFECWPNQDRIQRAVMALQPNLLVHGHLHHPYKDQIRCGGDKWTTVVGLDCDPEGAELSSYRKQDSWTVLSLANSDKIGDAIMH